MGKTIAKVSKKSFASGYGISFFRNNFYFCILKKNEHEHSHNGGYRE